MTQHAQYILTKYIPQLDRNEPRNIGVIVWTEWGAVGRFIGESQNGIDGRKLPAWVQHTDIYKEWVHSWKRDIQRGFVRTRRGAKVDVTTPSFLDAIAETGSGNYVLADRGVVLEEMAQDDVGALVSYLFEILVEVEPDKERAKSDLDIKKECSRLIRETGYQRHPLLKYSQPVMCSIAPGVIQTFNFDYWLGNGKPRCVYQRIPYTRRGLDTFIKATSWQFEKTIKTEIVDGLEDVVSLIMPTTDQLNDPDFQEGIAVLQTESRIINLTEEPDRFQEEIKSILDGYP